MKKLLYAILISGLACGLSMAGAPKKPECPMMAKGKKCAHCPEKMNGVETVRKNTANGVEITLSAKGKEAIAKVQEMALAHYNSKDSMCRNCPARVEGARVSVTNTATGAKAEITGATPEVVRKIQEASMKEEAGRPAAAAEKKKSRKNMAGATAKYICPMGCATSDKPGKCPKCGMQMKENK